MLPVAKGGFPITKQRPHSPIGFIVACLDVGILLFMVFASKPLNTKKQQCPVTKENVAPPLLVIAIGSGSNTIDTKGSTAIFTYEELVIATDGFSESNLLGQDGFSYIYKGCLTTGQDVADKKLKLDTAPIEQRHCLFYEFVPNKTLEFHMHENGQSVILWESILKIAIGSAKGIAYLHEDCKSIQILVRIISGSPTIIHRDIKHPPPLLPLSTTLLLLLCFELHRLWVIQIRKRQENMGTAAAPGSYMVNIKPCISSSRKMLVSSMVNISTQNKEASWTRLASFSNISSRQPFLHRITSKPVKFEKFVTRAMSEASDNKPLSGLPIDLRGKRAFIAGVADDNGYGWAIAKSLAAAGAEILVGTWVPALNIFESSLRRGKFDESRVLPDGSLMEITKVYPMDAVYDTPEDVPEDVKMNKRYAGSSNWTVQEVVECVKKDFGSIDILVHSLANGPEVSKPLLETSRNGYLAALSASSYSYVSLLKHFLPIMNQGGASISLTYIASERIIPGYGGGMSSAKAALESDTRVMAFEAGRKHKVRVNTISAGPLRSRAAKAIGFIDMMIDYSLANAPLQKELSAEEVGNAAAFLASPLSSAITGVVVYVDNGLNAMGVGVDSPIFANLDIPKDE
ncbi:hypothetical protein GQ457_02G024450 [Hibiscus cannabinus]